MKKTGFLLSFLIFIQLCLIAGLEERVFIPPTATLTITKNKGIITDINGQQINLSNPNKVRFAWDWDDTLTTWHYITLITKFREHPLLFAQISLGFGLSFLPGNYFELGNMFKQTNPPTAEDMYYYLKENNTYPHLSNFVLSLGNLSTPKPLMIDVVKQLHAEGYDQAIATNKHLVLFEYVQKKEEIAPLISILQKALVVSTKNDTPSRETIVTTASRKPALSYYQDFEQAFNQDKRTIIFIDDKKSNFAPIINGELDNWIGIHFVNEELLIEDLQELGIL